MLHPPVRSIVCRVHFSSQLTELKFSSVQGLKSRGNSGNAVPTRKFDILVLFLSFLVGTYVPTRRKGLAKLTGALTTNDVSILELFSKQQTVVSVANSQTFEDQTLQFFLLGLLRFDIDVF